MITKRKLSRAKAEAWLLEGEPVSGTLVYRPSLRAMPLPLIIETAQRKFSAYVTRIRCYVGEDSARFPATFFEVVLRQHAKPGAYTWRQIEPIESYLRKLHAQGTTRYCYVWFELARKRKST